MSDIMPRNWSLVIDWVPGQGWEAAFEGEDGGGWEAATPHELLACVAGALAEATGQQEARYYVGNNVTRQQVSALFSLDQASRLCGNMNTPGMGGLYGVYDENGNRWLG